MKRVLLTGASGFIGRHALRPLLDRHFEVHAVGLRPLALNEAQCHFHRCDLLDARSVRELVSQIRPTHLLHFAWFVKPGEFWTSANNVIWLSASLNLLLEFAQAGGSRSVFAGTCAEYEWTGSGICEEDATPLRPATLYGVCKNTLREVQEKLSAQLGFSAAWGRIFHLYGPQEPEPRLVPSVICALLRGENAACTHGTQLRDLMHAEDVATAFVALLDSDLKGAVNIASGIPVTIKEVVTMIGAELGRPELLAFGALPVSPSEPARLVASVEKLQSIGFLPKYSLEQGLRETIHWWKSQKP